ncbi:glutamate ABC transporter substrate-binding protein [Corynebacterium terpenotabidum]|uniref:Solute-binding protein family 3/N-terminal domain-containing protein n=1 Tax=Corynebacterium terpenotabidum Y-11 TaxID=1200352 RepID=S4XH87_9CORY|nr:glutamate ABC transporter substrate-binding protein [Corynebacterium terpenotabidum]AGP30008.1 hypothetical protein A606_01765 [Corynebacterium terpenotabidum Y-11]
MRHRTRRTTRVTLAAVLLVPTLALTACDSGADMQQWPDPADPTLPLPAGASFSTSPDDVGPLQDDGGEPFGSLAPGVDTPEDRVPEIIERGRLIVGVAQSMNQLGFRDPVTGDMAGFEVDLAHEIARDIFGDPDRVDFRYVEGSNREDALRDGDVDIVVRSMTITRARQTNVEFSAPYLSVSPGLLVSRDSGITGEDDLTDRTVCVTRNSTSAQSMARDIPHGRLLLTETWPDCLMAMQHDQVDAIYSDSAVLSGLRAQDPNTEIVSTNQDIDYYGVATAPPTLRDTAGLVRQVNATLERIREDGTWVRIYNQWLAPYIGASYQPAAEYRTDEESTQLRQIRLDAEAAAATSSSAAPSTSTSTGRATTTADATEPDEED